MRDMNQIGFVVIEFNQASGQPGIAVGTELMSSQGDAQDVLDSCADQTASVGRRETYRLAEVRFLEDDGQGGS